MAHSKYITVRGASQHNLKNITISIPRDKLVVITGVSGSGKSTLAFNTIYAEGQRRYVESLSTYARQFIGQLDKPDVESIDGLSPAIAIEQRSASHNPRSTVGTVTEIYDYLRLLFARVGVAHCYRCGRAIRPQTVESILSSITALPSGTKINLLSPIVRGRKGEFKKELDSLRKKGFARVRIDGNVRDLSEDIAIEKNKRHEIDVVVDRLVIKDDIRSRLRDSVETALTLAHGLLTVQVIDGEEMIFSESYSCPVCGISMPELTPRMFSFNNPYGACHDCGGLGTKIYFDENLVVPDPGLSIREGAIAPWEKRNSVYFFQMLAALTSHYGFDINTPFNQLPEHIRRVLLYGSGEETLEFYFDRGRRRHFYRKPFEGVIQNLDRRYRDAASHEARTDIMRYMNVTDCPACDGARLRPESLAVTAGGKNIHEVCLLSIREAVAFFTELSLSDEEREISKRILKEIQARLQFLDDVGMSYLNLARSSGTLSGGEWQRIRLATQIGAGLVGVLYVLDEPTIGLHPRDTMRLVTTLHRLRDLGNTILVVEHDPEVMKNSDRIIDMGPGAGLHGGEVVFQGSPDDIIRSEDSLTGAYLAGRLSMPVPKKRRRATGKQIVIEGASENNLKDIDIRIPTGVFSCVTGVSGSGKSTMIVETLYKVLKRRLNRYHGKSGKIKRISDFGDIERVIVMDQQPIGRTPRSNPATYTGSFTAIRELFSHLPDARMRGYKPGRFSFNVKGGRCEACEGDGVKRIEMHFLPDVYVTCDVCRGKRYNEETLEISYKGKNIADILDMSVEQAASFFDTIPAIKSKLILLNDVGLGYIRLGQSATTLSGGEAQRIKLARELGKPLTRNTLYILDEPTIGLHFADIRKLLDILMRLVDMGNTVVVIEHNLDVIKCADYVIDMGPEGGDGGGEVVAAGTPEHIAACPASHTGRFLAEVLHKTAGDAKGAPVMRAG